MGGSARDHFMKNTDKSTELDAKFVQVAEAFADDPQVMHGGGTGFGSGALKVNGKIFAMATSRDEFVVKLPKERVTEIVASGHGRHFDAGKGKPMKEWLVVTSEQVSWLDLAKEARRFVGSSA